MTKKRAQVTPHRYDDVLFRRMAAKAIEGGYGEVQTPSRTRITVSGNCQNPEVLQRWGRPSPRSAHGRHINVPDDGTPYGVDVVVRCRRCRACLAHRANVWMQRATIEAVSSTRCWFTTLTFSPSAHRTMASRVAGSYSNGHPKYAVTAAQLFLKRLRKACGVASLRHVYVCELHESGLPHIHMLIYEQKLGAVTKRRIENAWGLGFTKAVLAIDASRCGRYVMKYLHKAGADAPIRASLHFGLPKQLRIKGS